MTAQILHLTSPDLAELASSKSRNAILREFVTPGRIPQKVTFWWFIDADTIVPDQLLWRINQVMASPSCFGGAVDTDYRPAKTLVKIYLQWWRILGKLAGMAQWATQFFRRDVYASLLGYDESLYMGEDVDFHWRLKQFAKQHNAGVCFIEDIQVVPYGAQHAQPTPR